MNARAQEVVDDGDAVQVTCWGCGDAFPTAGDVAELLMLHPDGVPTLAGYCPTCLLSACLSVVPSPSDGAAGRETDDDRN